MYFNKNEINIVCFNMQNIKLNKQVLVHKQNIIIFFFNIRKICIFKVVVEFINRVGEL